jgi:hypothetical protein
MKTNKMWMITAILLAVAATAAFAQTEADFSFDAATGTITKYSGFDTEIVIPAAIGGKPVKIIGEAAFQEAELTSATIPNGITYIGNSAFNNNQLTSVIIPGSVTVIGDAAFAYNRLTSVIISEGVMRIGEYAFGGNKQLASISFPSTLQQFPDYASIYDYEDDHGYAPKTIILAANVNAANERAFGRAVFYNYIANDRQAGTYTANMPYERKEADNFWYNETQYGAVITGWKGGSTRLRIPAELGGKPVKAIDKGVFREKKLAAVQLPNSLTYIGEDAFRENELAGVTFPAGLTYIGSSALGGNQLTSVVIPNGVTYIGDRAFGLVDIHSAYGEGPSNKLTSVTIGSGVTYIGDNAFSGNRLTSISIPGSVTYIGGEAFAFNQITSISIPATVKRMGGAPFSPDENGAHTFILQKDTPMMRMEGGEVLSDSVWKAGRYTWKMFDFEWSYSAK